ncbi:glycerol 3-phosphate dehydrogenase (NAD(P)+) [Methylobacillus rhizosphaerae]|uniref:Glycerol-3-phosphate dehydrogenase [NAD(P)+] n=1 Tax=Methylobacillus rhizosphaerae TaxID=551994 RepID=A0A238Y218_9PROT|nr:NAD(P)H-dependent glycerol-3-phosphate dehydrogenase [Methylobacillus rhizosphaerae]SNR65157.1 glycerol 3-phosphate dehydrogenase (NAD(P)+) [Methylobacillus rhizosphaerae]
MKISVLGAGAWGTALALQISRQHQVSLWTRNQAHIMDMQVTRANLQYLGDFTFGDQLVVEGDLGRALEGADLIVSVVPTNGFRNTLKDIKRLGSSAPVVWASKGLEAATAKLPHEVAQDELGDSRHWGVLSGPSFAAELVRGLPTAVTLAANDAAFAARAGALLHGGNFRVYTSTDVTGVSVGGALKNVLAIAAGISDGMQCGNNARAALITRGMAEITRFGVALGGIKDTFMGLTGAGDLILTCTGQYSRNREVGLRLANGQTLQEILKTLGHVAEGVHTAREVMKRAHSLGVEMPITQEVDQVLSHGRSPRQAMENLLNREQKSESL